MPNPVPEIERRWRIVEKREDGKVVGAIATFPSESLPASDRRGIEVAPVEDHNQALAEEARIRKAQWDAQEDRISEFSKANTSQKHRIRELEAEVAAKDERIEEVERERELAIAHDRQPYPTAEAYEKVCTARTKWQDRAEKAEAQRDQAVSDLVELKERLLDVDGPILLLLREEIGASVEARGWCDDEGVALHPNDHSVEALGNEVISRVQTALAATLSPSDQPQPNQENTFAQDIAEVEVEAETDRERADRLEVECRELEDANRSLAKMRDAALEGNLAVAQPNPVEVEPPGNAVEVLAERLYRFAALQQGWAGRWPDLSEPTKDSWREDARSHVAAITSHVAGFTSLLFPAPVEVEARGEDALVDLAMRAFCDPGQFTERRKIDAPIVHDLEPLYDWQKRALHVALASAQPDPQDHTTAVSETCPSCGSTDPAIIQAPCNIDGRDSDDWHVRRLEAAGKSCEECENGVCRDGREWAPCPNCHPRRPAVSEGGEDRA
jgi:hypothetical protein